MNIFSGLFGFGLIFKKIGIKIDFFLVIIILFTINYFIFSIFEIYEIFYVIKKLFIFEYFNVCFYIFFIFNVRVIYGIVRECF